MTGARETMELALRALTGQASLSEVEQAIDALESHLAETRCRPEVASAPTIWVAGKAYGAGEWDLLGVFSAREKAAAACVEFRDFVGPATLDEDIGQERVDWSGVEFPNAR